MNNFVVNWRDYYDVRCRSNPSLKLHKISLWSAGDHLVGSVWHKERDRQQSTFMLYPGKPWKCSHFKHGLSDPRVDDVATALQDLLEKELYSALGG